METEGLRPSLCPVSEDRDLFFGVYVPAVCALLSGGWPESLSAAWALLAPAAAAGLSAAISAVWNLVLEREEAARDG